MIALSRYLAADVRSGQRYLAPLLLYIAAVALLTDHGNSPILPSYALDAAAAYVVGAWLTTVIHNSLDRVRRDVITVTAGSALRVLLAGVAVAFAACVLLGLLGMVFATLVNGQGPSWADVLAGIEATLNCACVGVAIGTVCSSMVIRRNGYALAIALAIVVVLLLVRGVPPVNPVLRTMSSTPDSTELIAPLAGYLAIAAVLLALATAVTQFVTSRRD